MNLKKWIIAIVLVLLSLFGFTTGNLDNNFGNVEETSSFQNLENGLNIPIYSSKAYVAVNNNVPYFKEEELTKTSFENYSSLDSLGRCNVAMACIGKDIMPTEKRGDIVSVKPSGWHSIKCSKADGGYLYNRCHLIGFQLAGENANKRNLITGTRYLNIEGMLPFENMVADYVKETNNHVLYRVTPIYKGNNLVASGVLMEGKSVEDNGDGILFNVYCYNVQPGVEIDYATGNLKGEKEEVVKPSQSKKEKFILNTNSKKFHKQDCSGAERINKESKKIFTGDRKELINNGYKPCKICNP